MPCVGQDRVIGAIATAEDSRLKGVDPLKDPTENQLDFTTKPDPRSDPSESVPGTNGPSAVATCRQTVEAFLNPNHPPESVPGTSVPGQDR